MGKQQCGAETRSMLRLTLQDLRAKEQKLSMIDHGQMQYRM